MMFISSGDDDELRQHPMYDQRGAVVGGGMRDGAGGCLGGGWDRWGGGRVTIYARSVI